MLIGRITRKSSVNSFRSRSACEGLKRRVNTDMCMLTWSQVNVDRKI